MTLPILCLSFPVPFRSGISFFTRSSATMQNWNHRVECWRQPGSAPARLMQGLGDSASSCSLCFGQGKGKGPSAASQPLSWSISGRTGPASRAGAWALFALSPSWVEWAWKVELGEEGQVWGPGLPCGWKQGCAPSLMSQLLCMWAGLGGPFQGTVQAPGGHCFSTACCLPSRVHSDLKGKSLHSFCHCHTQRTGSPYTLPTCILSMAPKPLLQSQVFVLVPPHAFP